MILPAFDRFCLALLILGAVAVGVRTWLHDHPWHDPWAPLGVRDSPNWLSTNKMASLRADTRLCRDFFRFNKIELNPLPPEGAGKCRREDRQRIALPESIDAALKPQAAEGTCAVNAGLARWFIHGVEPAARAVFQAKVVAVEHLGTSNCRRIGGGAEGNWSEHATGNAIDVAAFVFDNGKRITVARDWNGPGDAAVFLRTVRDAACDEFSTVLSPDYNAAHADHLHLDQARRIADGTACR